MRRYRLSQLAKADLDDIWLRIAEEASIETADRFINTITLKFQLLARTPGAGRTREEIAPGLRSLPIQEFLIYYRRAQRGGILISRVIHGRRDQARAWGL